MRRTNQERWEKIRAGGKTRFIVYEVTLNGATPIVGTFIFYGLKMVWGKADFSSVPYGETAFMVCSFALMGYFRAERDWRVYEDKNYVDAGTSPNSNDRANG